MFDATKFKLPPAQPIDVFGSGHSPNSFAMKWATKRVLRKDGKFWTVLFRKDRHAGAFSITDVTEKGAGYNRLSICYYPELNYSGVINHLKNGTKEICEYFDIFDEIQYGIFTACMEGAGIIIPA